MKKRKIAIVLPLVAVLALLFALAPSLSLAEDGAPEAPVNSDSEAQPKDDGSAPFIDGLYLMGNDCLWAGRDLELRGHEIKNDLLAAGQVVNITECKAQGSIRAAGQDVIVEDSSAVESITVAGQNVTIRNTSANAIAMAGANVTYAGSCNGLSINASEVVIDGTVDGDVYVGAGQVEVGANARIRGTLHVSAASEPVMQSGAEVGNVEFTQSEGSPKEVKEALAGISVILFVVSIVVTIVGTLIVSVLSEWLFKRHTLAASRRIIDRTVPTVASGIIGLTVMPLGTVLLFLLVITIPVALALALVLIAVFIVAAGFMGASVFKIAFPRLGRFKCALAGGAIIGVASAIPILGILVRLAAIVYLLGYVLQAIYLGMRASAATDGNAM